MESATAAVAMPPAEVHAVPTSDGTEVRLTRYKFGTKGPLVLAPGYGNAARAFADRHRAQELGPVPGRARLRRLAARLPRQPGPAVELHPVHGRRHRAARLAGRDRHGPQRDRPGLGAGDGPLRRRALAVHGDRRRHAGPALSARSRRSPATRSPRPATRRAPGRAWRRCSRCSAIKGLNTDYDPKTWDGKVIEAVMKIAAVPPRLRQPGRAPHLLRLRRRLRLREHQPADDGAGRAELLRQRQHHVLRAHLADDPRERGARRERAATPTGRTSTPSSSRSTSSPASTTRCSCPKGLQRTYDTLRRAHGPQNYTHHVIKDYAHLDLWLGTERRTRRVADRPRRAGEAQLDEHHR